MYIGIDYGSKLAGTTAICYKKEGKLCLTQTKLKEDADAFIKNFVETHKPEKIFIDAPLSLPPAFFGKGDDFFYRSCDRELSAMSPMFLGGLTARAMKLKHELTEEGRLFIEIYPSIRGKAINADIYKKDKLNIDSYLQILLEVVEEDFDHVPKNWHQIDAVLAWLIGKDFIEGKATSYGDAEEGLIWV